MDVDGGQGTDSLASAPWPCCSNPVSKGPLSGLEERALTEKLKPRLQTRQFYRLALTTPRCVEIVASANRRVRQAGPGLLEQSQ